MLARVSPSLESENPSSSLSLAGSMMGTDTVRALYSACGQSYVPGRFGVGASNGTA